MRRRRNEARALAIGFSLIGLGAAAQIVIAAGLAVGWW